MIAALPMYDRPELRADTDALWQALRAALGARGIAAPKALSRDIDLWDLWRHPDLLLAQTCGLPYRARLADQVVLVGAPRVDLLGCAPGMYNSVILGRAPQIPARPRLAVNDLLSQSGWAALAEWMAGRGLTADSRLLTGAHEASAEAVAAGKADLAAIDAVTWRMLQRARPDLGQLIEYDRTRPTPALPYITARGHDPEMLRAAIGDAIDAIGDARRQALSLFGIMSVSRQDHLDQPLPPA